MVARAIPPSKKAPDYFRKRSGPFAVVDPTVCEMELLIRLEEIEFKDKINDPRRNPNRVPFKNSP